MYSEMMDDDFMLSIQEVGKQVLTGNPGKFYVFVGKEYGIKSRYVDTLKSHYGDYVESDSVQEVLDFMNKTHIIPLPPKLYIVRYDSDFIQNVCNSKKNTFNYQSIVGTIVCIYESDADASKCSKYLDAYTVSFDSVNPAFIKKYLISDFPDMSMSLIEFAVKVHSDYIGAYNICNCLSYARDGIISSQSEDSLESVFYNDNLSSDEEFKIGIASRNFSYTASVLDSYSGNLDSLFYTILNCLLELEKLISNQKVKSNLHEYATRWTISDIYYMFSYTYAELEKSRNFPSCGVYNSIIYLLALMQFSPIPNLEV